MNRLPYRPIVIAARFTGLTGADERQLDADDLTAAMNALDDPVIRGGRVRAAVGGQ